MVRYLGHISMRGCRTAFLGHVQDIPCQSPEQLNSTLNLAFYWAQGWTEQLLKVSSNLCQLMVLCNRSWGLWG